MKSLLPSAFESLSSGDGFKARLSQYYGEYDKLRSEASTEGKVPRYVGVIDVEGRLIIASQEM